MLFCLCFIKIHKLQTAHFEKEKLYQENHKSDLEQIQTKSRIELEKLKSKHFEENQEKINDYENKLTDMNLQ